MNQPEFSTKIRVYYEDTDAGGIVYYANYLKFAERCRTEYLRSLGLTNSQFLQEHGILLAVKSAAVDYVSPARLDDLLEVSAEITALGAASIDFHQIIRHVEGVSANHSAGKILATLDIKIVAISPQGRVMRLPSSFCQLI